MEDYDPNLYKKIKPIDKANSKIMNSEIHLIKNYKINTVIIIIQKIYVKSFIIKN